MTSAVQIVTLTREDLADLLTQAAAEGARLALEAHAQNAGAPDALLSRKAAATALGVSVATLDRRVAEGLPSVRVGSVPRFDLAACRDWLATREAAQ